MSNGSSNRRRGQIGKRYASVEGSGRCDLAQRATVVTRVNTNSASRVTTECRVQVTRVVTRARTPCYARICVVSRRASQLNFSELATRFERGDLAVVTKDHCVERVELRELTDRIAATITQISI